MADQMADQIKRKRSELLSASSIDTSFNSSIDPDSTGKEQKEPKLSKGQKKKKSKSENKGKELNLNVTSPKKEEKQMKPQLNQQNRMKTKVIRNPRTIQNQKKYRKKN